MKKSEGEDGLPEDMIQLIQSFLSGKEAARTTILSKSWYNAWSTRPNLVFNQRDFRNYDCVTSYKDFPKFAKKTLQRYRDLNLKIDSFKCDIVFEVCHSLANELIVEAIKMGATDICFETYRDLKFVLPGDVLESESLTRLSVEGCKMESVNVNCSTLKYLRLRQVILEGDLFWDLISSCPLIEDFELYHCEYLLDGPVNLFESHKLKTLILDTVKICSLFFVDFSSRFPCLKDLSIRDCSGYENLQIYSQSLEFISFVHLKMNLNADFDVPNLRKFYYSGRSNLPLVSFPNSCNWKFDLSISVCSFDVSSAKLFFLDLNKLLRNLSSSKVSLHLHSYYYLGNIDKAGNTQSLPRPLVENLTIDVPSSDTGATLLDSLIQWCRPVFVTQCWDYDYSLIDGKTNIESLENFYKRLMQQKSSVDDLEEVSVEVYDEVVSVWRIIPLKSLQNTSTSRVAELRIRFHLRWGQR